MRGVEIQGLEEAQAGLQRTADDLQGPRFLDAMRKATLIVLADAKRNAPVDTGRLRASITPEVRRGNPVQGVVGSNVEYAPYQELGTRWIAARRYLQRALEDNAQKIFDLLGNVVSRIVEG